MRQGIRLRIAGLGRLLKKALFAYQPAESPPEPLRGTARKVIVVPSPDPQMFEQAVFIVSDEYLRSSGRSQAELLRRAREAAGGYAARQLPRRRARLRPAALLTAVSAAVIISLTLLTLTGHI